MNPIYFEVIGSKVKVTVTLNTKTFFKLVLVITQQCLDLWSSKLTWRWGLTSRWTLFILRSLGQRSRSQWPWTQKPLLSLSEWWLNNAWTWRIHNVWQTSLVFFHFNQRLRDTNVQNWNASIINHHAAFFKTRQYTSACVNTVNAARAWY